MPCKRSHKKNFPTTPLGGGGQKMTKIVAQHIIKCNTWALFSNTMCP